jgi:Uma2 family endonuclease
MNAPLPLVKLTAADYLTWENQQSERHIFVQGEIFGMSGGTAEHNLSLGAVYANLWLHLKSSPCRVFVTDMRVAVEAADAYYYPDVVVTCNAADLANSKALQITAPKLIVEVLSPSTASFDRGQKFAHYRTLDSLEEYVLIDPELQTVDVYRKNTEAGLWTLHPSNTITAVVTLSSVEWQGLLGDLLS